MRRAVLTKSGGPESFQIEEAPIPEPGAHEILIQVDHAGVAFADVMMRHGKYPGAPKMPFTPGYDVCGTVTQLGSAVTSLAVGDKVIALTQFGGYAEYCVVHEGRAARVPKESDTKEAAALALNYVSAYEMLHKYRDLAPGSIALIHSAAGGVGTAALQIAQTLGLKVYGTCSAAKTVVVAENGGLPIDYQNEDFVIRVHEAEPQGVDIILDPIGGGHWMRSQRVLKSGGLLVGFGLFSIFDKDKPVGSIMDAGRTILSLSLKSMLPFTQKFRMYNINPKGLKALHKSLNGVVELYSSGKVRPVIGKEYPLEDVGLAHDDLANGRAVGKLVLNCRGR